MTIMKRGETFEGNPCLKGHTSRYVSNGDCVVCAKARANTRAMWLKDDPQEKARRAATQHTWYIRNKVKVTAKSSVWKKANPEKHRESSRKAGWKMEGYPEPTRPRPAFCECCGGPPGKSALHLDHDHRTGKFRGWLCSACNLGIGKLGDSIAGVLNALRYLYATS
jgi:hypothetical protein